MRGQINFRKSDPIQIIKLRGQPQFRYGFVKNIQQFSYKLNIEQKPKISDHSIIMCDIKNRHIIYVILTLYKKANDSLSHLQFRLKGSIKIELGINLETYFWGNRLQNNLHYYIYLPDIIKYIIMNKSLFTESVSKLNNTHALFEHFEDSHPEMWTYSQAKSNISIQLSDFILIVRHISCNHDGMVFLGALAYPNGRTLFIPIAYREMFFKIANKNAETLRFFIQEDRNQLLLRCSLSFESNIPTIEKINQCLKSIYHSVPFFEKALQAAGLIKKFNKYSLSLIKSQLKMKKAIMNAINSSSIKDTLDEFPSIDEQNSSVVRIKEVIQNPQQIAQAGNSTKKGGYFQIQKKKSIIHKQSGQREEKQLAWKTPLNFKNLTDFSEAKMKKQIQLVQKIVSNKYLLTYYVNEKQPSSIYMDYVPGLLKDYIHKKDLSFQHLLNLAQQLVESVAILHRSNIVHRDLKPENVLVDGSSIKLIDYAQSATMSEQFTPNHLLGCTLPYSPIECILRKEQGFNKSQIDLWSIPMILYEMAFKNIPMFYTRFIGFDILQKWRSTEDFSIFPIYRKKRALMSIESVISLIAIRGIQINPKQRLSLKTYKILLNELQEFCESISNIA